MGARLGEFTGRGHHRQHHLEVSVSAGACERPELSLEQGRPAQRQAQSAHAEKWVCFAVEGDAGDRLVASRVERTDGHRPLAGPFEDPAIGVDLRRLVRRGAAGLEQEFGAHEADAVGVNGVAGEVAETLNVDQRANPPARARHGRRRNVGRLLRLPLGERRGAAVPLGEPSRRGRDLDLPLVAVEQHPCPVESGNVAKADHHRHAAGARQNRDMARRTARHQRDAARARPVDLEKARRGQVVGEDDRFVRQRRRRLTGSGERAAHPVAQIDEIGCARPESVVLGRGIVGDLGVERPPPCARRRRARLDLGECRVRQFLVLEQRQLEFENCGRLALLRSRERRQIGCRSRDRLFQRAALRLRRAEAASLDRRTREARQRPGGEARRRRAAAQSKRLNRHRESPARRGRPARRPPPAHRRPPRGNGSRRHGAPWPP